METISCLKCLFVSLISEWTWINILPAGAILLSSLSSSFNGTYKRLFVLWKIKLISSRTGQHKHRGMFCISLNFIFFFFCHIMLLFHVPFSNSLNVFCSIEIQEIPNLETCQNYSEKKVLSREEAYRMKLKSFWSFNYDLHEIELHHVELLNESTCFGMLLYLKP